MVIRHHGNIYLQFIILDFKEIEKLTQDEWHVRRLRILSGVDLMCRQRTSGRDKVVA